ncbi:hypothetical protein [Heliophilum fasciatum]|nr:hypothetical protein [Heliophilum fasciatum]MCW2278259.1 hypothetical protein [Heliophilum fasciatum]
MFDLFDDQKKKDQFRVGSLPGEPQESKDNQWYGPQWKQALSAPMT